MTQKEYLDHMMNECHKTQLPCALCLKSYKREDFYSNEKHNCARLMLQVLKDTQERCEIKKKEAEQMIDEIA